MKIRFSKLMALVAVLFGGMLASCAPEEITRVPAKMSLSNADEMGVATLTLSSRAETKSMSFEADGDWYIRIPKDCDWLTVSPASGTGNATVNFTSAAYDQLVPRTTKVAFVVDGVEQKALLEVTQLQQYVVNPVVLSTVVPKTGGEYTVNVETNGTFDVALTTEGAKWIEIVTVADNEVVLNATPIDASVAKNKAKLTFTCKEDAGVVSELNISQKNLEISIDAQHVYTSAYRGSGEVGVNLLNVTNWVAESNDPWLKATKVGDKLAFEVIGHNPLGTERRGSVAAVCADSEEDSDVKGVIEIIQYPNADIVDFVFNQDGTAYDGSPRQSPIESKVGPATMSFIETHALWGPTVLHGQNNTISEGYWKSTYYTAGGVDLRTNLENGYTMESIFSIPTPHVNKETKAFSATGSGGFAIMLGNTSSTNGSKETIQFIQHDNTSNPKWRMAATDIKPVPGQIYHVFGVWDPSAKEVRCYVDGVLCATKSCEKLQHMNTTDKVFTVAANHTNTGANGSWNGSVYAARVYDWIMTDEEIATRTMLDHTSHPGCIIVK